MFYSKIILFLVESICVRQNLIAIYDYEYQMTNRNIIYLYI